MDSADPGLEGSPQPVFHPVRRENAGLLRTNSQTIYTKGFTPSKKPQAGVKQRLAPRLSLFIYSVPSGALVK